MLTPHSIIDSNSSIHYFKSISKRGTLGPGIGKWKLELSVVNPAKIAAMRSHVLCLLVVLAALVSTMRVGAKPSFTMPDGDDEEEDVAVAADPVEIDEQGIK